MEPAEASESTQRSDDDQPVPASTGQVTGARARNALDRVTNLDLDGVQVQGPREGFGALWRKRYWVWLRGSQLTLEEIIRAWREHFGEFWPEGNAFAVPFGTVDPGDVGLLNIEMPGGARLSSGVVVLNAGPESFTLITPEGHMFAGVITFSAFRSDGIPVAQIEIVMRASDPLFEIGMELFGHRQEDRFWQETLGNLAAFFGVSAQPGMNRQLLSRDYQWSNAGNVLKNSFIRGIIARGTAPISGLGSRFRQQSAAKEQAER